MLRRALWVGVLAACVLGALPAAPVGAAVRDIHFPTGGPVSFRPDFGAPRSGGRTHAGNDLFGPKLTPLLAAVDGRVVRTGISSGNAGNYLVLAAAGWEYKYLHLNNDSPGTDDGANPGRWRFAPGIGVGAVVRAGDLLGYLGDSGNAEGTPAHLHFEIRQGSTAVDPRDSLLAARAIPARSFCDVDRSPERSPKADSAAGYWHAGADGGVFTSGDLPFLGSAPDALGGPVVGLAARPGGGYWMVAGNGRVAAFGAPALGDLAGVPSAPVVDITASPSGGGYWLATADGRVHPFGDAAFLGDRAGRGLNRPVVGMAATADGRGYWLVAGDGGVFTFGSAAFHGSTGDLRLNEPVTDLAPTPSGAGYWMVATDGGVFSFGDAGFVGSVPGTGSCGPLRAVALAPSPVGIGYWIQSDDGRTWAFGDAADRGDAPRPRPGVPVVDLAVP